MTRVQDLVRQVSVLAAAILPTLIALTVMGVLGAVAAFVGAAASDEFGEKGLLAGVVVAAAFLIAPWLVGRFALDVRRIRALPEITTQQVTDAALQLGDRLREGEAALQGTGTVMRLWRVRRFVRLIKADLEDLADGGLAPAASLVKALVPTRLLLVGLAAVASPFLLAAGLAILGVGLIAG